MLHFRHTDVCNITPQTAVEHVKYEQGYFDTLSFGQTTIPFQHNSIMFIPNLLSVDECAMLVKECEHRVKQQEKNTNSWLYANEGSSHKDIPFERFQLQDLSRETQTFFDTVLRSRLLPFVEQKMPPIVAETLREKKKIIYFDPDCCRTTETTKTTKTTKTNEKTKKIETKTLLLLAEQDYIFSETEPSINRYTNGGKFPLHRDALALTVNVLLSDEFTGGGTSIWEEMNGSSEESEEEAKEPTLTVLPKVGVGVIFNGTVKHAGRSTEGGVRHLLVASFSMKDYQPRPHDELFLEQRQHQRDVVHTAARIRLVKRLEQRRNK